MTITNLAAKLAFVGFGFVMGLQSPHGEGDYFPSTSEIIDILADFDLTHIKMPPGTPYYALTDFQEKKIWIVDMDVVYKKRSVIHELIHIKARMNGVEMEEEAVSAAELMIYKKLFVEKK